MSELSGDERARYVRRMFGRLADHYDLLNRLITFGQDRRWRREAVRRLGVSPSDTVLDLGAGTGDLAFEILRREPEATVVAADFTPEMIRRGRQRARAVVPSWLIADARQLPFPKETFSAVVSGFLLRNIGEVSAALREQVRVLKPGGRLVCLETTPPNGPLKPIARLHLQIVIPLLGGLLTGDRAAYQYLPDSTEGFHSAETLAQALSQAGLRQVGFSRKMLGTVAVHWGEKG